MCALVVLLLILPDQYQVNSLIGTMVENRFEDALTLNVGGHLQDFNQPKVMAILNCTPDSFFDGGKNSSQAAIQEQIQHFVNEGADIIDVGGYSSRPGADDVSEEEEWERIEVALQECRRIAPTMPISVDTFRASIAEKALQHYNVEMINDISAGDLDANMISVIAKYQPVYIIMHMLGTPKSMQINPTYKHITSDVMQYFAQKLMHLNQRGVTNVVIDPGFGFGKTIDHNYYLLANLHTLRLLEVPILVGLSRKSMLYKFLNTSTAEALNATSVTNFKALEQGANILRVHDVREARECVQLHWKLKTVANS